jgi:hypothetical protein
VLGGESLVGVAELHRPRFRLPADSRSFPPRRSRSFPPRCSRSPVRFNVLDPALLSNSMTSISIPVRVNSPSKAPPVRRSRPGWRTGRLPTTLKSSGRPKSCCSPFKQPGSRRSKPNWSNGRLPTTLRCSVVKVWWSTSGGLKSSCTVKRPLSRRSLSRWRGGKLHTTPSVRLPSPIRPQPPLQIPPQFQTEQMSLSHKGPASNGRSRDAGPVPSRPKILYAAPPSVQTEASSLSSRPSARA